MIDTHSHLYDESFSEDIADVIKGCQNINITAIVTPAIDRTSYSSMNVLSDKFKGFLFPTMGLHPTSVDQNWEENISIVRDFLEQTPDRYVAVGEIGMDLYWSRDYYTEQCKALEMQIELSIEFNKPLILHIRKAYDEIFPVLEKYSGRIRGVVHSFEGTETDLERINDLGDFYIGVGGISTYKKRVARLIGEKVPLEKIVLETDSPYLTPAPFQGERNSSLNLPLIVKKLSEIFTIEEEYIIRTTDQNSYKLFPDLK